ncbi:MAG: hypothetical protein NXI04_16140 [Planctomycetaceae bacterium]|nr:hypothetical protein [Planctomycetaceae bacterium]
MDIAEILFVRTWWEFAPPYSVFDQIYHWFNVSEGLAWFVFAGLVWQRGRQHSVAGRPSRLEVGYAFAFATFGLTDLQEAWQQSSWLIWLKLINLITLAVLRRRVMTTNYPEATLY